MTARRLTIIVMVLLFPILAWANARVRGRVLDDKKQPLQFANVRLYKSGGSVARGMTTDAKGSYSIPNVPAGTYTLEVTFVGYKTHKASVAVGTDNKDVKHPDIVLSEDGEMLKEIAVVAKATEVAMKGDTIEYNASSFKTAEGAALEELIKKLPGATIDKSGNITINGKSISQIMVDGKRFFESDPKVAVKNIPAELIEKVQVLDKESDAARMSGFADGEDETIINLTIKPGRKQGLFGTAYAGAGTKKRYEVNAMVNRFSGKNQWTILGGVNNTNNAGFSDIASDLSSSGIAQQAMGARRQFGQRFSGNDGITISRILGGNMVMTIGSKAEGGGSAFFGNSDKTLTTKSETTNIQTTGNTLERSTTSENNNKYNIGTDLRFEWKPNAKTELIIMPHLSYGTGKGVYNGSSTMMKEADGSTITTNDLIQTTDSRTYNGRMHIDFSRRLGDKGRTLSASLEGQISNDDTEGTYLNKVFTASTNTTTNVDQLLGNTNNSGTLRLRTSYVEPLGGSFALQASYQFRVELTRTDRNAFDFNSATNAYDMPNASYSYGFKSTFMAHTAGLAVKSSSKVYDITAGINVIPSTLESTTTPGVGMATTIRQQVVNFSPTLRFSYKPSKAFNVRIDYRGRSFQPRSNQLAPIQDATNLLMQYVGNPDLKPGFQHNIFGHLSLFSPSKQRSFNIFARMQVTENNIVSSAIYDQVTGIRTISYQNVNGQWNAGVGGFYTTPLFGKKFSLRAGTRSRYEHQVGFVDGQRNEADLISLSNNLTLAYRHGILDTSLGGDWTYYTVTNSIASQRGVTTNDYGINWDTNISLPFNLTFDSQVHYTATSGYTGGYDREQTIVNLGLSYSFLKGRAATIRLKVYDLLAQQRNVYQTTTAISQSRMETNMIGRYAMLHFIYKFNSFSGNASAEDMRGGRRGPGGPPGRF